MKVITDEHYAALKDVAELLRALAHYGAIEQERMRLVCNRLDDYDAARRTL